MNFRYEQGEKPYYHESECNIRSRLGSVSGKRETWYPLRNDPEKTARSIIKEVEQVVLPVFAVLCDREAILAHRRDYPQFDCLNCHLILLEECFLKRHLRDEEGALACFRAYYRQSVEEYERKKREGSQVYLKKGERMQYRNESITADKSGFYTIYDANDGYITYLKELAKRCGFDLDA